METSKEQALTAQRDILTDGIQELTAELEELQTKKRQVESELFGLTVRKLDVEIRPNNIALVYINEDPNTGIYIPFTVQEMKNGTLEIDLFSGTWVAPMGKHGPQFRDYVFFSANEVKAKIAKAYAEGIRMGGPVC